MERPSLVTFDQADQAQLDWPGCTTGGRSSHTRGAPLRTIPLLRQAVGNLPRGTVVKVIGVIEGSIARPISVEHVAAIAPRPLLLQFAEHDCYLAAMVEFEFKRAAGDTAELKRYPGGHDLKVDAACDERQAFLNRLLATGR